MLTVAAKWSLRFLERRLHLGVVVVSFLRSLTSYTYKNQGALNYYLLYLSMISICK